MFNFILLFVILLAQFLPSLFIDSLTGDRQWQVFDITMLSIIFVQAIIIFRDQLPKKDYTKILSFIILVVSLWFLLNYVIIDIIGYNEVYKTYQEIGNG